VDTGSCWCRLAGAIANTNNGGNSSKGGKIIKTDISIAKNYLSKEELDSLNRFSVMFLDYDDSIVRRGKPLKMADWVDRLDSFLRFNEYDILTDNGRVSHEVVCKLAEKEYEKFRVVQDKEYKSDFDKIIEAAKTSSPLPKEPEKPISTLKTTFKLPTLEEMK
jgi:hypothetical protein